MASAVLRRTALTSLVALRPASRAALRPVAAAAPRFMSGRTPNPDPVWKQASNLDNIIPSDMDQATGIERAEILAEMEGKPLFEEGMVGPFGTDSNPVMVESIYEERIVGCPGDCDKGNTAVNNEMRWFLVTSAQPYKCASCGQVFALKKIAGAEYNF
eukprot:CAMPEP_0173439742 /NCGR_PEP_ID=MMETSP1357-20121228/21488_1 /TAXON_ID=77926 /ORGANISM="Hemiselmis rufescens, Strain PCC563" /LENGTH=157 /DNA_ID=CAMNT_0014405139 /DNA_START=10 /DNA_END=483 /DNA_ORIENTATION=+